MRYTTEIQLTNPSDLFLAGAGVMDPAVCFEVVSNFLTKIQISAILMKN